MKNTIFFIALISILSSCNFVAGSRADNYKSTNLHTTDSVRAFPPVKDASITSANYYSDLFLDSAAVENFISNNKLENATAQSLRNFYLMHNYQ